jgi:hypothetical protein
MDFPSLVSLNLGIFEQFLPFYQGIYHLVAKLLHAS